MRRILLVTACLVALSGASAEAGTVSGTLEFCETGDECRYFPNPRLALYFIDEDGETNELLLAREEQDIRVADGGAPLTIQSEFCDALGPGDAQCGPRPIPGGPYAIDGVTLTALTGAGDDMAWVGTGAVDLGPGDDAGRGQGAIDGGLGKDDIRWIGPAEPTGTEALFGGDDGEDVLIGGRMGDDMTGGPGPDLLVGRDGPDELDGGRGRDQLAGGFGRDAIAAGAGDDLVRSSDRARDVVHCGSGRDRAFVSRNDRVRGCERVRLGWPG